MRWDQPLAEDHNGVIRHYQFTLYEIPTSSLATYNASDLFIVLENLHPHYDYEFGISAVTVGPGPSTDGSFKLLEDG